MPCDADIPAPTTPLTMEARIQVLLEEYRALYRLLTFRLGAIDRRLPVAGGTLGALLGATTAMPPDTKLAFLLGLPVALLWLLLSTVQHARSKEDHLRRIDEIERLVNRLAGEELLVFQSRHPNKQGTTAGRCGFGAVLSVLSTCSLMLAACCFLVSTPPGLLPLSGILAYYLYNACIAGMMLHAVIRLRHYRYRRPPADGRPLFEVYSQDST
jgi:hypothetical protein